ncbi:MAG: galactokinase [Gemmatimonadota bacterium]
MSQSEHEPDPGSLAAAFRESFGGTPTHLSRAPGRVNLIGEHTDYNDLPVLPMALQREVRLAFRARGDDIVRVANLSEEFHPVEFRIRPGIERSAPGHWGNYVKAPFDELARRVGALTGFEGVVTSDIPVASGLSSSSALVNSVGLALSHVNELGMEALELADTMAEAERYTGTRGGGMDQAVSMAAEPGHASRIDFAPLRIRNVAIPAEWRFVVADSGVRAEKSGKAQREYNLRRRQCEEALARVAGRLRRGGIKERSEEGVGYPTLLETVGSAALLAAGEGVLSEDLFRRFRHVVTEARRVELAETALAIADGATFGALMDASHRSLREDYAVSIPELDALVACARDGGAVGARLTGAGFGGCIVALSMSNAVGDVLEAVRDRCDSELARDPAVERAFVAMPSGGASVRPW